jgi:hypothetical protein
LGGGLDVAKSGIKSKHRRRTHATPDSNASQTKQGTSSAKLAAERRKTKRTWRVAAPSTPSPAAEKLSGKSTHHKARNDDDNSNSSDKKKSSASGSSYSYSEPSSDHTPLVDSKKGDKKKAR